MNQQNNPHQGTGLINMDCNFFLLTSRPSKGGWLLEKNGRTHLGHYKVYLYWQYYAEFTFFSHSRLTTQIYMASDCTDTLPVFDILENEFVSFSQMC